MIKRLCILSIICASLAGCDNGEIRSNDGYVIGFLSKVEFEGHTYIVRSDWHRGGICHDENCKCKKSTSTIRSDEVK